MISPFSFRTAAPGPGVRNVDRLNPMEFQNIRAVHQPLCHKLRDQNRRTSNYNFLFVSFLFLGQPQYRLCWRKRRNGFAILVNYNLVRGYDFGGWTSTRPSFLIKTKKEKILN